MGTDISMRDSMFFIPNFQIKNVLAAGKAMTACYKYIQYEYKHATRIDQLFRMWGYMIDWDETGNITSIALEASYLGDEFEFFKIIAPFVKEGSYIEIDCQGEKIWRWVFDGKACRQIYPKIVWD